ncbi:MAG: MFS transporter [Anaerolineae bacterium]|nr:MFS transporter [Anaerolineae bacterium]
MKLDWRKTFLIGLGFLGISVIWQVYNLLVPIMLQAGSPDFNAQNAAQTYEVQAGDTLASIAAQFEGIDADWLAAQNATLLDADGDPVPGTALAVKVYKGFGLSAFLTGTIMTLDNIAALFILPLIGVWSDRTRTRIGRRYPYILGAAPVAAVAFILIPLGADMITLNGQVAGNEGAFALFIIGAGVLLLGMAILRTPIIALMPDLIPSPLRSKANGVINFMGGVGGILAALGLVGLFDVNPLLPFAIASVLMIGALLLLFWRVREPDVATLPHPESDEEEARGALKNVRAIPPAYRRSLFFLLAAIFCWFVGYNAVETFFSSYAVTTLGVSAGSAGMLFSVALLTFIIFAIPAGYIGTRLGRRRTISIGLVIFGALLVVAYLMPSQGVIAVVLGVGGLAWALVNINSLPMVVDVTDDARLLGTYTGLYYLASQSAAIFGPILNGWIIDLAGRDYSVIFLVCPAFFAAAAICMIFVTRGEAHAVPAPAAAD